MEIKAEIQNTVADVNEAYILHVGRFKVIIQLSLGFIFIIGSLLFLFVQIRDSYPFSSYSIWILILFYGGYKIFWFSTLGKRWVKKNPSLLSAYTVVFTDDEIHIINESGDSKIKWHAFAKAQVNDKVILIYPNQTLFYFFSKRFFSEREYAELSEKVRQIKKA